MKTKLEAIVIRLLREEIDRRFFGSRLTPAEAEERELEDFISWLVKKYKAEAGK